MIVNRILATIRADDRPWYMDHDNISHFCYWLVHSRDFTAKELLGVIEKPYNWSYEYRQMQGMEAGTHGECVKCTEITDQKANDLFVCPKCIPF